MQLNIRGGRSYSSGTLDFSFPLDLSGVKLWGRQPFPQPVTISGQVRERAGIMTLRYTAEGKLCFPCARCLADLQQPLTEAFTHTVAESVENPDDDEVIIAAGGIVDMSELVTADICLSLEPVTLCSPDCKGLCPKCGVDLNNEACKCS